jgi:hypothetical protein
VRVPLEEGRSHSALWYNRAVSASDPRAAKRTPTEPRRCDACGRVTTCVLLPKGGGQVGALCTACLARALGGMKDGPNW